MLKRWDIVFIFILSVLFLSTHSKANLFDDLLQVTNKGSEEQLEQQKKRKNLSHT